MLKEGGGVASKLQKKLIKNEKRERRERRQEWTETVGGGQRGERKREGKKEGKDWRKGGKQCFIESGWTNSV